MTDVTPCSVHNQTAEKNLGSPEEENVALSVHNVKIDLMEESCVTEMMMRCAGQVTPKEKIAPLMYPNHPEEKWCSQ
jgi:hypothetical protein